MKIYLIGYKNSGKSTTGRKLAKKLGLTFVDLDELIEKFDGRTVPEIFSQDGEDAFRIKEQQALHQTESLDQAVISTGGGVPRFFDNMQFMNRGGITIYLKLDEETLVGRLKNATRSRPIVQGKTTEELHEYVHNLLKNFEHYYLSAHYVVDAKNTAPEELIARILSTTHKVLP